MKHPPSRTFHSMKHTVLLVCLLILPSEVYAADDAWGDLRGEFTFQGTVPQAQTFPTMKDGRGIPSLVKDESLLVDPETRGIENIVVWLERDSPEMPIRRGYGREMPPVTWSMRAGAFSPHVITMSTHQKLFISQTHGAYSPKLLAEESANYRKLIAPDSVPYLLPQPEKNQSKRNATYARGCAVT